MLQKFQDFAFFKLSQRSQRMQNIKSRVGVEGVKMCKQSFCGNTEEEIQQTQINIKSNMKVIKTI